MQRKLDTDDPSFHGLVVFLADEVKPTLLGLSRESQIHIDDSFQSVIREVLTKWVASNQ
jgi:hypothetical protein